MKNTSAAAVSTHAVSPVSIVPTDLLDPQSPVAADLLFAGVPELRSRDVSIM